MKQLSIKVIEYADRDTKGLFETIDAYARTFAGISIQADVEHRTFNGVDFTRVKDDKYRVSDDWLRQLPLDKKNYDLTTVLFSDGQWFTNGWGGYAHGHIKGTPVITMTATDGQSRDLNETEETSEFVARFLHELSHTVFDDLMKRPDLDTTHYWDYDKDDLTGALEEWDLSDYTTVEEKKGKMKYIISLLTKLRSLKKLFLKKKPQRSRLNEWAKAIKDFEVWAKPGETVRGIHFPNGSLTYRLNNPGALRYSPTQDGTRDGFAYFSSYEDGWQALLKQLRLAVDGRSAYYEPDMTLREFFHVWAPTEDQNYPDNYAEYVADRLGVSPQLSIRELGK